MRFEDIFKEEGLYVADSFAKGTAFKVKANSVTGELELYLVTYSDKTDISPLQAPMVVYAGLFNKSYTKKLTIYSLFEEKPKPKVYKCYDCMDSGWVVSHRIMSDVIQTRCHCK